MWDTSEATRAMEEETEELAADKATFSDSVQVKVTVTTVWMRVKMAKDTGFWLTIETIVVVIVVTAEHERVRGATSREVLEQKSGDTLEKYPLSTSETQLHQAWFCVMRELQS